MMSQSADNLVLRIGRRIAALRKEKGLTQAQLAERLAIAQKNVHRLESGTQNLTLRTIAKIADAIGVQIDDVLAPRGSPDFLQASQTALATTSRLAPRPVPVFDIVAAAGFARDGQLAAVQGWALVDQPVDERHFVVRVEGDSMMPQVAPGSWCLFRRCRELPSRGAIVLVEKNQEEGGGGYLLKRLERIERSGDGAVMVMLSSSNPDHPPLALPARSESDVRIVAELVCIVAPG